MPRKEFGFVRIEWDTKWSDKDEKWKDKLQISKILMNIINYCGENMEWKVKLSVEEEGERG